MAISVISTSIDDSLDPAERLRAILTSQLDHVARGVQSGIRAYDSLRNISEVIGGEYGDRVIFELIQNAHDAHEPCDRGRILVRLVLKSEAKGDLYIANGGRGFSWENVDALRNIGLSSKTVGEGIGNKGLGFRSVETLTDDPHIYSQPSSRENEAFDGYCFRFASHKEVVEEASPAYGAAVAEKIADTLPRYLAAVPIAKQDDVIRSFARDGFATVVHLPLKDAQAVTTATGQIDALLSASAPLLLFLDRLERVTIETHKAGKVSRKALVRRTAEELPTPDGSSNRYEIVAIEPGGGKFVIAKRSVDAHALQAAVEKSISREPQLVRWREWSGDPVVSVAIPLDRKEALTGSIYNFLPMGPENRSPLFGHIDAPFYASIDRRRAHFDLPLNAFLLDCVALCGAQASLDLKGASRIDRTVAFDFAAWNPDDTTRIIEAWDSLGWQWQDALIVPDAGSTQNWIALKDSWVWSGEGYRLLRPRRLIKAGIENLADPALGIARLTRLEALIDAIGVQSTPLASTMAEWSELVAGSLLDDRKPPATWTRFYEEIGRVLASPYALHELRGKAIFKCRDNKLHASARSGSDYPIFVRERIRGKRRIEAGQLPPAGLSRKFAFLSDDIELSGDLIERFVKADLLCRYDAIPILEALPSLFGEAPAPARRKAALEWAFSTWRNDSTRVEASLKKIDLWVEAVSGWEPARNVRFSEGWTAEGRTLSTYLAEAAPFSPDCREAAEHLLAEQPEWAPKRSSDRKEWISFLRAAGVRDGLPLLADESAPKRGMPAEIFNPYRRTLAENAGRNADWVKRASAVAIENPFTMFTRKGEVWRFAGQVEHDLLPYDTKVRLADLILIHLLNHSAAWRNFSVGRFERYGADQRETLLPTPARVFIEAAAWMPVDGSERFARPADLWISSDRRQRIIRQVDRPKERIADVIADQEALSAILVGGEWGIADWADTRASALKLQALALVCQDIQPSERVTFRRTYHRAWQDACAAEVVLPKNFVIATQCDGAFLPRQIDPASPFSLYVTSDLNTAEAQAVSAAGLALLEVGNEEDVQPVLLLLDKLDGVAARPIDQGEVAVELDGIAFTPSSDDTFLVGEGREWLVDAALLANDILGKQLERGIPGSFIEERLRRIRLRFAREIRLAVSGVAGAIDLPFYAYDDPALPTLCIGEGEKLSWAVLAESGVVLSPLVDSRLRSLESLLTRLALRNADNPIEVEPSDEALAKALGCRASDVHEFRRSRRQDDTRVADSLEPVLIVLLGVDEATRWREALPSQPSRDDLDQSLAAFADRLPIPVDRLLEACATIFDAAELRRHLGLNFAAFNDALLLLGRHPVSNETELRRLFEIWKKEFAAETIDRLRRHFWSAYQDREPLAEYAELRLLEFISMPVEWVSERETLDKTDVREAIMRQTDAIIGEDVAVILPKLQVLSKRNNRRLQKFIESAAPIVRAWCFGNEIDAPRWRESSLAMLRDVERTGLLDFALLDDDTAMIATLVRAGQWPPGMPHSTDLRQLELDPDDLEGEKKREERAREEQARQKRLIKFAGIELDTGAPDFADRIVEITEASMSDGDWLKRSRRKFKLAELENLKRKPGGRGKGKGSRTERPSEALKTAMGFAGELIASKFLAEKHKQHYSDDCWVSRYRAQAVIGSEGDDALGYDFQIELVEGDWRYEVKAGLDDKFEFEFTQNEMRVASQYASDAKHKYRILYVPFVFTPEKWRVMELPNPMSAEGRALYRTVGSGSTRLQFELE